MRRFFLLLLLVSVCARSWSAVVPVSRMQNAVSGVMQSKMISRGFASNDPRFTATLNGASGVLGAAAGTAAAVTIAGVTAPAWVTAGLAVGLSSLFAYGLSLAFDGLVKWFRNSDGTVSIGFAGAPQAIVGGSAGFVSTCANSVADLFAGSIGAIGQGCAAAVAGTYDPAVYKGQTIDVHVNSCMNNGCNLHFRRTAADGGVYADYDFDVVVQSATLPAAANCASGLYLMKGGTNSCFSLPGQGVKPSIADAAANVSDAEKAKALAPEVVAAIADDAWRQAAAAPGYDGLPYDASNPVSRTDAATWKATNPNSWPTVGDVVTPQPAPTGGTSATPFKLPTSTTPVSTVDPTAPPNPATNPAASNPLENLGPDPGIGAPALEPAPTARMILDPLLNLFPSLRNFAVPNHNGVCPKPSASAFSKTLVLDAHCAVLEPVRPALSAMMAFVWVAIALLIVLAA